MAKKLTAAQCASRERLFEEAAQSIEMYCPDELDAEAELLERDYVIRELTMLTQKWANKRPGG